MAKMIARTTFTLDEGTVAGIRRLARQWGVSQAEVVRRVVAQAVAPADQGVPPVRTPSRVAEARRAWPDEPSEPIAVPVEPPRTRGDRLRRLLEREIWPAVPPKVGEAPLTKAEREAILGYGPDGV